jgi:putative ABC transport system permease protein
MRPWDIVRVGAFGLVGNKLRSALTMLGVIIGVAAVIALVSIGQGASRAVTSQIEGLGSNLIIVSPARGGRLTMADTNELRSRVQTIESVVPSVSGMFTVKWQNKNVQTTVEGTVEDYCSVRNFKVERGRFITATDVSTRRRVAVVGQTLIDTLFSTDDPIGQTITIAGQPFLVVGVMEKKGSEMGRDRDDVVFTPITTLQRLRGTSRISTLFVRVTDPDLTADTVARIKGIFERKLGRTDAMTVRSQEELLATVNQMTGTLTMMLAAIAGISLLVGGIGIMNIMLVSVTERTREIGLRKAVGATKSDILGQFLVEAVLLSLAGGAAGIAVGIGASRFISQLAGWMTYTSPSSIIISFGFAAAVGVFFGIWPALKASALDPIDALRRE